MRKVVRKYISKKTGELVTKTYTYESKRSSRTAKADTGKRIVVRKYTSKKSGELVTKTYTYGKRGGDKSLLIIGKNGKVYNSRIEDIKASVSDLSDKYEIEALVRDWTIKHKGEKLTLKSLQSRMVDNRYEKMFLNVGYSLSDAANEIGVNPSDLTNPKNWDGNKFTIKKSNGELVIRHFKFDYYGSVWY